MTVVQAKPTLGYNCSFIFVCFSDLWEENGPLLGPTDLDV